MALSSDSNTLLDLSTISNLQGAKVAIIATEWNDNIVAEQLAGAQHIAQLAGADVSHKLFVPGCVELPYATRRFWEETSKKGNTPDAIIVFGAVVRGGTPHFEYVCNMVSEGVNHLNLTIGAPVIFGVLTVNTEEQAWERLGGIHGHKGQEAMITALKMIKLEREIIGL